MGRPENFEFLKLKKLKAKEKEIDDFTLLRSSILSTPTAYTEALA